MKTDFEIFEACDLSITLMTSCVGDVSEKLRKNVLRRYAANNWQISTSFYILLNNS